MRNTGLESHSAPTFFSKTDKVAPLPQIILSQLERV